MSHMRRSHRITAGAAALLAMVALAGCGLIPSDSAARRMLFESSAGEVYKAMERADPDQFDTLLVRVQRMMAQGRNGKEIAAGVAAFMLAAEEKLKPAIRQAGHATIAKYRRAEIDVIEAIQAVDPRLCAHYIAEGGLVMPYSHAKIDAAIARQHALAWEAAAEGRDRPAGRMIDRPSKADWAAIDKAMIAAGLKPALVRQFFDPATARRLPAETQCSTGIAFHKAIEALPEDRADSFYFAMMDSA